MKRIVLSSAKIFALVFLLTLFAVQTSAAPVAQLPYDYGFEDATENAQWTLNSGIVGATLTNKWYVSSAQRYSGSNSLLISNDNGVTAAYSNVANYAVSYREFSLPAGNYDLSFAWKSQGEPVNDGLYVCWVPQHISTGSSTYSLPSFVNTYALTFDGERFLTGTSEWITEMETLVSSGGTMKLIFVWVNNGTGSYPTGACVDNIQIAPQGCDKPHSVNATVSNGTDAVITWQSTATEFELRYRAYGDTVTTTVNNILGTTYTAPGLEVGLYDFWIRSVCGSDTSVWVNFKNILVYSPGEGCVDYTDLTGPNTHCTTGVYANPYQTTGVVDHGYASINSRHTMHYNPGETDARTKGRLTTVPPGEVVSIRLGNWDDGAEAESITYTMPVPAGSQLIMTMKYAIVLEAPGHGAADDPYFHLEILDMAGNHLDMNCTKADFWADKSMVGSNNWYLQPQDAPLIPDDIVWKDWTTVGINLTPYAGQTIQIRLTTQDCDWSAHCGYAYFTLRCSEASISGLSCGDIKTASVSAPDGFRYEWYKATNPGVIVGTDKDLDVDGFDTATYHCDVIYKENENCKFTLSASLLPRYPNAQFAPKWEPKNCQNIYSFRNSSGVITDRGPTSEKCSSWNWDFGDGRTSTDENPVITYPPEGGTFNVKLVVGISDDMCKDTMEYVLDVPNIADKNDTTIMTICSGESVIFNGDKLTRPGLYPYHFTTSAGCDSTAVCDLRVIDKLETDIFDSICFGEQYNFNGQVLSRAGSYSSKLKSKGNCDSIVTLNLHVFNEIKFNTTTTDVMNGPTSGSIDLTGADSSWVYTVNGVENAQIDSLPVGTYAIYYTDTNGCVSDTTVVSLSVQCVEYTLADVQNICADDEDFLIPVEITDGKLETYSLIFSPEALAQGFTNHTNQLLPNDGVTVKMPDAKEPRPDTYTCDLVLNDLNCDPQTIPLMFSILYPSDIMQQKWNDVIALYNQKYNGGYVFSAYQWYRNGAIIPNEIGPYLYLNGTNFNNTDVYSVMLTREDDGKSIMSCLLSTNVRPDGPDYPVQTVTTQGAIIEIQHADADGVATWYDVQGRMYGQFNISGETTQIEVPNYPGLFLLEIETGEDKVVHKVFVK